MIYEMAQIEVVFGKETDFEASVTKAIPLFNRARGCKGVELHRGVEQPLHYLLVVRWDTVEDHTVHFRESEDFEAWRGLVAPFLAKPPVVSHTEIAVQ